MNILRILFELFVIYIVYKLIVDFIIPVYKATRHMKDAIHKAQDQMNQQNQQASKSSPQKMEADHDYIDYEEVR